MNYKNAYEELKRLYEQLEQQKYKLILDSNGLINANGILQQENAQLKEENEKLKEELGDSFEEYMYKANIELLTKIDKAYQILDDIDEYMIPEQWLKLDKAKRVLKGEDK